MVWPRHPEKSKRKGISMEPQVANSNPIIDLSRCQHRFPSRRRCRLPISDPRTGLCANHARELQQRELADLSSALVGQMTKFETSDDINDVLSRASSSSPPRIASPPAAPPSSPTSATFCCAAFPRPRTNHPKLSSTLLAPTAAIQTPTLLNRRARTSRTT